MLRGIRKASANWLGRIVMGVVMTVLAASFAVWGINDIFRGFGRSTVAKIGSTEIPIEQFRQTYNDALQTLGRQSGHVITPDEAMAHGVPRQVLSEMVAEAGLNERARQMRLGVSDAEISRRIVTNPSFQNQQGQFDRARFEDAMRNAGFNEQRFVAEQRNLTLRRQIINSVSGNIPLPDAWLDALNQFQNQERSIAYIALGPAQAGDIAPPTAEELSKYFEARKILFRAPEFRKVATVVATPAELAKTAEVPDEDVKQIFDTYRNRYITPERRHIEQMVFPNMAEAQAASDRIKGGLTFAALAAERGLKEQDLDLGTVAKSTIIDPTVADAAFSLKEGEVSAPVQGKFGVVIVTVSKIIPEDAKTFADVAPQIRNEIALARVKKTVQDIHDKIEDARAGGASLEEAAQKLKLPVVTYDAVDRSGRDPAGKPIENLLHASEVVNAAFATDVGVDNDPLEADGGYIWYDVTGITPARERNLDEVKSQVEAQWRDDEVAIAAEGQGGRHPRQAEKRRHARGHGFRQRRESRNRKRHQAQQAVGDHFGTDDRRHLPYRLGCLRQRRGRQADAMDRVPGDRRQNAEPRQEHAQRQATRRDGIAPSQRRRVRPIHGVAGKRSRHHRQSGGAGASLGHQRAGYQLNADRAFGGKIRRPL